MLFKDGCESFRRGRRFSPCQTAQFSSFRRGTLRKSFWLHVTKVAPLANVIAAISRSHSPIFLNFLCSRSWSNSADAASIDGEDDEFLQVLFGFQKSLLCNQKFLAVLGLHDGSESSLKDLDSGD